jgi:hypothetical protein
MTDFTILQIDGTTQRPGMDSGVSYATVFRIHQRRPFLGNGYVYNYCLYNE